MYKKFAKCDNKQTKWANDLNRHFNKKRYKRQTSTRKDVQKHY